ncbi:MAG: hypothetical protein SOR61_05020 [Evtepia sp.]|nr:hypothetical protein [Evtepia sp.]
MVGPDVGERVLNGATWGLGGVLAAAGVWVLSVSGNFSLLLCAAWLLCRRKRTHGGY